MSLFVAIGHNGQRLCSENGVDWKGGKVGNEGETYRCVAFGNGRFVAVGGYGGGVNIFMVTADGEKWDTAQLKGNYQKNIRGLAFNAGTFYAIGGDPVTAGLSKPFVTTSEDGLKWSEMRDIGGANMIRRLAFGNGLIVGVGDRGRRAVSTDSNEWKDAPGVKAIETLVDVAFGAGRFVGVGLNGLRMTSEDGLSWINKQVGNEGEHLNSIVWAGDRFVAVGAGATYFSPDGWQWERRPNEDAPLTCVFGDGVFLGSNWKGRILLSSDGVQWKQVHKCENHIEQIAFGPA